MSTFPYATHLDAPFPSLEPFALDGLVASLLVMSLVCLPGRTRTPTVCPQEPGTPEARAAATVFRAYVEARGAYDVPKVDALEADDHVWIELTGERRPRSARNLQNIVEWEQVMGTKWTCRILGYTDGVLEVEMRENNHLYDVLGVGAAVRQQRERISGGQLHESQVVGLRFTGRPQDEAFAEFENWLRQQPAARQEGALHNGHLVFTGDGARQELPLLDDWSRSHRGPK